MATQPLPLNYRGDSPDNLTPSEVDSNFQQIATNLAALTDTVDAISGTGQGVTQFVQLSDKASADIPNINTPTANALSGKLANSHAGAGGTAHAVANPAAAGFMSGADKAKLDSLSQGAASFTGLTDATTADIPTVNVPTSNALAGKLPNAHAGSGGSAHAAATPSVAGFMSAGDKTKLDSMISGPPGSGATMFVDLTDKATADIPTINTPVANALAGKLPNAHAGSGGSAHAGVVAGGAAGFMSGSDKSKLDSVAASATSNLSDAALLSRANHTGSQASTTISDFSEASQDVIGAMVTAAGGSYNDAAGTIVLPAGGSSTYAGLTDKATVDLPTINVPLSNALAGKSSTLAPVNLGSGPINLTAALHANRGCYWSGSTPQTISIDPAGGQQQDIYSVANRGSAVITFPGSAGTGYKLQCVPSSTGATEYQGGSSFFSQIPDASGGSSSGGGAPPGSISALSGTAVGNTLHFDYGFGWYGMPLQWEANGVAIAGQTGADLVITNPSTAYRCLVNNFYASNTITSDAAVATVGFADTANRANSSNINPASDGGTWSNATGAIIESNSIYSSSYAFFIGRDHHASDQHIQFEMFSGGYLIVLARSDFASANCFAVALNTNEIQMNQRIGGTESQLPNSPVSTLVLTAGTWHKINIDMVGSALTIKVDDVVTATSTYAATPGTWIHFYGGLDATSRIRNIIAS